MDYKIKTNSKNEMIVLGNKIASFLFPGSVIALTGDLGAGKTTISGGIAQGLNVEERVVSPTFNIMRCYFNAKIPVFHIDAYRLEDGNKDIGLEEFIEGSGVTLIEWPLFISELINFSETLNIDIRYVDGNKREIIVSSVNEKYFPLIRELGGEK